MDQSQTARLLAAAAAFTPSIPADDERAIAAWHTVIGDLDYVAASRAVQAYYRIESWPITPAEIVKRVKAAHPVQVPRHLRCPDHPDLDVLAQDCPHCRRLERGVRLIGPPAGEVMAQVRRLAEQAALDSKARDAERAADLKRKADDAARRAAEKLERKRQIEAYAARGAPQSDEPPSDHTQSTPAPDRPTERRLGLSRQEDA